MVKGREMIKTFEGLKDLIVENYSEECPQCNGAGECEVDYDMPHGFGRDVGFIDTRIEECDMCNGSGEVSNHE
tara:strand:+ start:25 stop:243 length:219 start_codon:yes stop_codon:yes gene_type:complete